ncbi:D-alanyl-D-alanine carboxypeptidase family protein [Candidatus Finniella inopinata]|uniref:D-alanyl-D-alanine carboxypeptidase n=1 Tax=Candidatus Finniella inopinata TaxID=1696036 RepID=A0A4Q7DJJ2_9PROT|nr:D-alanyl-D-alanine carboxypeptidase family protein [Candidatus Finniella inopinata]RZI46498.1 D-alanyl-D-alanine carboxypeptidase [Candidatus Finniella inopinata]
MSCFLRVSCLLVAVGLSWGEAAVAGDKRYAAIVIDDATGKILHSENAHARRHPASLTKKMTLYLLFEALKAKKITLNTRFSTSHLATRQIPCKLGLQVGHTISVEEIIKGMVTKSANDAAVVFAEGLAGSLANFVALMNKKAKKLGMSSTRFYNASGVPDARQITTAMDMAILARALHHDFPEYYHYFRTKHFHYKGTSHRNHNQMLGSFQGLDGIKTGFVNASGFNISTSALRYDQQRRPRRLFAVVMGGQSWRSRDKRTAQLLEEGFYKVGAYDAEGGNSVAPELPDSNELQNVSYDHTQKQELEKSVSEEPEAFPQYDSNDAKLLETSLKTSTEKKSAPSSLPDIIVREPAAAPKKVRRKARVMSVAATVVDGQQRALPPGWVVPKAPSSDQKTSPRPHSPFRLKKNR